MRLGHEQTSRSSQSTFAFSSFASPHLCPHRRRLQSWGSVQTYIHQSTSSRLPHRLLSHLLTVISHLAPPYQNNPQINWMLLISRQGKVRLAKWFSTMNPKTKSKIVKDVTQLVLARRVSQGRRIGLLWRETDEDMVSLFLKLFATDEDV